jgi:hypothetical protein
MKGAWAMVLSVAIVASCVPTEQKTQSPIATTTAVGRTADSSAITARENPSSTAASANDTLVRLASIAPAVSAACDSAAAIVREELSVTTDRRDGDYRDRFRGTPRNGCRLAAEGSFKALQEKGGGPVDLLRAAFIRHGWRPDERYSSDGPDGSNVGMRRRDVLCRLIGSWDGGDDSDTVARAPTAAEDIYRLVIECARDVVSNTDADVPDSIWSVAANAGLDSVYAISLSMRIPPYIDGDFDGDGVSDAAVLVEHRMTGKLGLAIVHRGTRKVTILGAGAGAAGPHDMDGLREWDVVHRGSVVNPAIQESPYGALIGDALWVALNGSAAGFYIWNGSSFAYESHRK